MGYASITDIEKILAQALTSANPQPAITTLPGKLTNIAKKLDLNLVTEDDVNFYIRLADAHIDAALSEQYVTPLREVASPEMKLLEDVGEYGTSIVCSRAINLVPGDIIVLLDIDDPTITDRLEVEEIDIGSNTVITREDPLFSYRSDSTRVLKVQFPQPIPFISARLAAATIYDKYIKAQSAPDKTEYGESLKGEALSALNNIREGRTILHNQTRVGWRFANPTLLDRYALKKGPEDDGTRSDQGPK